jgi:hypothetical protein
MMLSFFDLHCTPFLNLPSVALHAFSDLGLVASLKLRWLISMEVSSANHAHSSQARRDSSEIRGKFWPKSSAWFLARTACLCVGTSFLADKIDRRHDNLTATADQKSLDLPSPRVGI